MSTARLDYDRDAVLAVLRDLNQIVVSLDRIGSVAHVQSKAEQNAVLATFIMEWQVFRKLAQARSILSEPFSDERGADGMDELERAMSDVVYWSHTQRAYRET